MKTTLAIVVLAGVAASASAQFNTYNNLAAFQADAGATQMDSFENAPWVNGSNARPTVSLGVSWNTPEDLFTTTVGSVTGTRALSPLDGNVTDQFDVILPAGIRAIGLWASTFGQQHTVIVEAFDSSNQSLGQVVSPATSGNNFLFVGAISTTPIASLTIIAGPGAADDFMIDDFYFGEVPAPSAAGLLGVAGLAALRRRR